MRIASFTALLLLFAMFSCNKPPEACIEIDNTSPTTGTPVRFSASCSKRSLSYIWEIDGPASAPENTMFWGEEVFDWTFSVPGTYTVSLEVYEKFSWNGEMGSTTTQITVN